MYLPGLIFLPAVGLLLVWLSYNNGLGWSIVPDWARYYDWLLFLGSLPPQLVLLVVTLGFFPMAWALLVEIAPFLRMRTRFLAALDLVLIAAYIPIIPSFPTHGKTLVASSSAR